MAIHPAISLALLLLAAEPARGQTAGLPVPGSDAELESLIPDSAVRDPEAWAKVAAPQDPVAQPTDIPEFGLDPSSPMAADADFQLPWPDESLALPELVDLSPDPDMAALLAEQAASPSTETPGEGEELRISAHAVLVVPPDPVSLPMRSALAVRFAALSTIERLSGEGSDNPAQLAARARKDGQLLQQLLRGYGYFDAEVVQTISALPKPEVRFQVIPGPRYAIGVLTLGDLAQSGADYPALLGAWGVASGDPLDNDAIVMGRTRLDIELGERGFALADTGEPELVADHARELADLSLPVKIGGRYRFGGIVSNLPDFLPADHLADIARFRPGELFRRSNVEDLRRAIVATGLVSSVTVTPRVTTPPSGEAPGELDIDVAMAKAPLRTLAGALGYDAGEGFRVEASWEHRNLFPPEGLLRLRAVAGTREQLAGVTFRRNNFHGRDQVLTVDLYATSTNREAYVARSVALSAGYEKLTTLLFQKPLVWSLGLEALLTNEREGDVGGVSSAAETYYVFALPLRGALDTTDDLLDPRRGFRAALRVSPEGSISRGAKSFYARFQADGSAYLPLGKSTVLAARVRLGSIVGAGIAEVAPSRRFFAGGGGSVRGFGYQEIGPRDTLGTPSGGRSLSEFSLEARIKTGILGGQLSVVPFIDAGTVEQGSLPSLKGMRYGAGLGLRYQTGFGPIRIDVATPLGRRAGESPVAVYVALGQSF
jgi:translocation and assembly module TamA